LSKNYTLLSWGSKIPLASSKCGGYNFHNYRFWQILGLVAVEIWRDFLHSSIDHACRSRWMGPGAVFSIGGCSDVLFDRVNDCMGANGLEASGWIGGSIESNNDPLQIIRCKSCFQTLEVGGSNGADHSDANAPWDWDWARRPQQQSHCQQKETVSHQQKIIQRGLFRGFTEIGRREWKDWKDFSWL
jgi:hypothetical protein